MDLPSEFIRRAAKTRVFVSTKLLARTTATRTTNIAEETLELSKYGEDFGTQQYSRFLKLVKSSCMYYHGPAIYNLHNTNVMAGMSNATKIEACLGCPQNPCVFLNVRDT